MKPEEVNYTRYQKENDAGHYESFFLRANHPTLPQAFWFRYTIFVPKRNPQKGLAELWGIWFDGTQNKHIAVKKEIPLQNAVFENQDFYVNIDGAFLDEKQFSGSAESGHNKLSWELTYAGSEPPLLVLSENLYSTSFPKAKLLVGKPLAKFNGSISVNNEVIKIENWIGSQNHNWGMKHTDHYAWGQVAGFDNAPDTFFEIATARLKVGPFWTPFMTVMVLKHQGRIFQLNTIPQALKATAKFQYFNWNFQSANKEIQIQGEIIAQKQDFVGLRYYNPPGGVKSCLNTKIACCNIMITYQNPQKQPVTEKLHTDNRCAFEILTDDIQTHQIDIEV
ncbi:MAG: hypothetical protein LC115_00190 [Bacteroidia bacterium]|nr:hypothetical protein [Bacteroidia bacterium]